MMAVTTVSERSSLSGLSRSACGGDAPTSFLEAHSHSAAGPSDTGLAHLQIAGEMVIRDEIHLNYESQKVIWKLV
jgi:hypothetical protein